MDRVEALVTVNPEYTLKDLQNILQSENADLQLSLVTIHNILNKLMITLKRSHRELERVNEPKYVEFRKSYSIWFNNKFKGMIFF